MSNVITDYKTTDENYSYKFADLPCRSKLRLVIEHNLRLINQVDRLEELNDDLEIENKILLKKLVILKK